MPKLVHQDMLIFLLQVSILLISARLMGELARKFKQPAVMGELLAGIILGPTLLGGLFPEQFNTVFLEHRDASLATNGMASIAVVMLLFTAGMEVHLSEVLRDGKAALSIGILGFLVPFAAGFGTGFGLCDVLNEGSPAPPYLFALFLATAMSITALPVIAKILIDLRLLNSRIGRLIISAAMMEDLIGWLLFSAIVSLMQAGSGNNGKILLTLFLTLLYALGTLTLVRWTIRRLLPLAKTYLSPTAGVLSFAMSMCFIGAVITEYIGIHGIFGAFIMGIAFGESEHFGDRPKEILHQFISNIFAPIFFVSIGLQVDLIAHFDLFTVALVLVLATLTKLGGGALGGWISGFTTRESLAIGFGMNARGTMEIILATLALQEKLINQPMYVALIIMAILTSVTSGGLTRMLLGKDSQLRNPETPQGG